MMPSVGSCFILTQNCHGFISTNFAGAREGKCEAGSRAASGGEGGSVPWDQHRE